MGRPVPEPTTPARSTRRWMDSPHDQCALSPSSINRTSTAFSAHSPALPLLEKTYHLPPHPPQTWHTTTKVVEAALTYRRTARIASPSTRQKCSSVCVCWCHRSIGFHTASTCTTLAKLSHRRATSIASSGAVEPASVGSNNLE
jgi:hypothetical protein